MSAAKKPNAKSKNIPTKTKTQKAVTKSHNTVIKPTWQKLLPWVILVSLILIVVGRFAYNQYTIRTFAPRYTESQEVVSQLKTGSLVIFDTRDVVTGTALLAKNSTSYFVELSSDFSIRSTSDIQVWLVQPQELGNQDQLDLSEGYHLDLGILPERIGKLQYKISEAEYNQYQYAVVLYNTSTKQKIAQAILY
jgi:hypothetical protein